METVQNIDSEFNNIKKIEDSQDSFLNGGLGLAKTYWLFGFLGAFIIKVIMNMMVMSGVSASFILIVGLGYSIPIWIAVWNSATKYNGFKLWSILAKVAVVLGVLLTLGRFTQ